MSEYIQSSDEAMWGHIQTYSWIRVHKLFRRMENDVESGEREMVSEVMESLNWWGDEISKLNTRWKKLSLAKKRIKLKKAMLEIPHLSLWVQNMFRLKTGKRTGQDAGSLKGVIPKHRDRITKRLVLIIKPGGTRNYTMSRTVRSLTYVDGHSWVEWRKSTPSPGDDVN